MCADEDTCVCLLRNKWASIRVSCCSIPIEPAKRKRERERERESEGVAGEGEGHTLVLRGWICHPSHNKGMNSVNIAELWARMGQNS